MTPFPPGAALIPVGLVATTLFPSFFAFDALVKREYELHREVWKADGRPYGMFWRPDGVGYSSNRMRWFTVAWYVGLVALAGLIVLALPYYEK